MSERERRTSTGGTGDNVKGELNKASQGREGEDATKGAVEEEGQTPSTGGMKDNVDNDQEKSQERS